MKKNRLVAMTSLLLVAIAGCASVDPTAPVTQPMAVLSLASPPHLAGWEPTRTPARSVPAERWGALRPVDLPCGPPCVIEDSTHINGEPGQAPFFYALDIEGDYLFTATGQGMKIYGIANPSAPIYFPYVQGSLKIPWWKFSDKNAFITSIAVPPGNEDLVVTGAEEFGIIAWDVSNKGNVGFHYGDDAAFVRHVHAATIGGREYAFAIVGRGVRLYDLTVASAMDSCHEQTMSCPGVSRGEVISGSSTSATLGGTGHYLVYRDLATVKVYDVSNPLAPSLRLSFTLSGIHSIGESALWFSGGAHIAIPVKKTSGHGEVWVYDVSCIASSCSQPLKAPTVYPTYDPVVPGTASLSHSANGTPVLYVGSAQTVGACTHQREFIYDATDPKAMFELTPQGHPDGYWGWYYEECFGFNNVAPRSGMMRGDVLYRAGYSILDSHHVDLPDPVVPEVFVDGFETGNAERWSSTVP